MALPANISTVTVTGEYVDAEGVARSGTVSFTPTQWLRDDVGDVVIPQIPVVETLDSSGEFSVTLAATSDTDFDPSDWAYVVTESIDGVTKSYLILLPASSPNITMAELNVVTTEEDYFDIRGPRGYSVLNGSGAPSSGTGEDGDFWKWEFCGGKMYSRGGGRMYGNPQEINLADLQAQQVAEVERIDAVFAKK